MIFKMEKITERFIRYAKIYTTSDPKSETFPSTERQLHLSRVLKDELEKIGLQNILLDKNGYLSATLPANADKKVPVTGFIAHMDTSPDFSGEHVKPRLISDYQGGVIKLDDDGQMELDPAMFPELQNYIGQDLLVTDGKTLLGADDKAGIAEIVSAMEYLVAHPEIKHGNIRVCFTPDEEIGKGADFFDVKGFGADFAYTLDGGEIGELEYENFNAAGARILIQGRSVHPGYAKNKMINAILVANHLINFLPAGQRPEHTEKYEGFYHVTSFSGNVSEATVEMIIRDHDMKKFEFRKKFLTECCALINLRHGEEVVKLQLEDQYYNMRQKIEPVKYVVDIAEKAMRDVGVEPKIRAIRGGTDGARLSFMGLPCPNIFTGGHNFHGPYEYLPVRSMEKASEVVVRICELVASL
mgnify:CR=1 FL=1